MTTDFQAKIGDWVYQRFHSDYLIDESILTGKRVLIVGSGASVEREALSVKLAEVDIVIKANYGIRGPLQFNDGWSARTDILFSDLSGAIKSIFLAASLKHVVARVPEALLFHRFIKTKLRFDFSLPIGCVTFNLLPLDHWVDLSAVLGGYSPTTGFAAIDWVKRSGACRIGVIGFSFYRDGYRSGYAANYNAESTRRAHAPEAERQLLRYWIQNDCRFWLGSDTRGFIED